MHKKLIPIAEHLICEVETQMEDLENVCTKELGEVVDMIKDLSKAIYYDVVTEAMLEVDELTSEITDEPRHAKTTKQHHSAYEKYSTLKTNNSDQAMLIKELDEFMSAFQTDVMKILEIATPEEKQYMHKKMTILANKIA